MTETLNERFWIVGGGVTPEWKAVAKKRLDDAVDRVGRVAKAAAESAPAGVKARRYLAGLRYFADRRDAARDRLALHPGVDYWLFLWDKHFSVPSSEENWHLHLGQFQGFSAELARLRGESLELDAVLDPDARLHLYGGPYWLAFPKELAQKPVTLAVSRGGLRVTGPDGLSVEAGPARLKAATPVGIKLGPAVLGRCPELRPGLIADHRAWLLMHGVTMHGLAHPDAPALDRFCKSIQRALDDLQVRAPGLLEEMLDMVTLLVPLENPMKFGSVSSSYANLRGMIGLSHSEDAVLQAETLIHEFCHQKMNQLLAVEPLLLPGQGGQVFYSPWRKDARRLRGLLLGAHAFLNVGLYLLKAMEKDGFRGQKSVDLMLNVALRAYQVEDSLRSAAMYASLTEFGNRFLLGMWRELGLLLHGIQWFPPALLKEAKAKSLEHRAAHALFDTGFHRAEGFVDGLKRAAYLTPGGKAKAA